MYRLDINSYGGSINVQSPEFAFLVDVREAVKAVVQKHNHLNGPKATPVNLVKVVTKRGRGRPAGSTNKAKKAK